MKVSLSIIAALAAATMAGSALAAKKYWINIGCAPDYKLHRIACDVGTSWKVCARAACGFNAPVSGTGAGAKVARRAEADTEKEPKLLGPLPAEAR